MERVLEMDDHDGYTIIQMYLMFLNYTLEVVKVVNFMLCIFYHKKTIG